MGRHGRRSAPPLGYEIELVDGVTHYEFSDGGHTALDISKVAMSAWATREREDGRDTYRVFQRLVAMVMFPCCEVPHALVEALDSRSRKAGLITRFNPNAKFADLVAVLPLGKQEPQFVPMSCSDIEHPSCWSTEFAMNVLGTSVAIFHHGYGTVRVTTTSIGSGEQLRQTHVVDTSSWAAGFGIVEDCAWGGERPGMTAYVLPH